MYPVRRGKTDIIAHSVTKVVARTHLDDAVDGPRLAQRALELTSFRVCYFRKREHPFRQGIAFIYA